MKIKCGICGTLLNMITHAHLKLHNMNTSEYKVKFGAIHSKQRSQNLSLRLKGRINVGEKNAAKRKEVKEKISASVKARWREGNYRDRVNGMLGRSGLRHHNFNVDKRLPLIFAELQYDQFLSQFEFVDTCRRCGCKGKIQIHHIDENHENILPTNLEPLCDACHLEFHRPNTRQPFLRLTRTFSFAAAHRLPEYNGLCANWHGHEWRLDVSVRKRIDRKTGMVIDFHELKKMVTSSVIDVFDHNVLNSFLPNPTAENILIWIWKRLTFDACLKGLDSLELWESPNSSASISWKGMLKIFQSEIEEYVRIPIEKRKL
jgi:6-pyruvoyltetrahydropterin/6-carboxytetrahydropterin synthase